jgi:hypothetical protein
MAINYFFRSVKKNEQYGFDVGIIGVEKVFRSCR